MLVVMIGIRKALDLIFTRRELKILDDIMPEMTKRNQMLKDDEVGCGNKFARFVLGPKLSTSEYREKDGADCVLRDSKLDHC